MMELSSLKAPRPVPPKLSAGDKRVQGFLRDLEKIKTTKRHRKKVKRCETLIYKVVQCIRKEKTDHLLYTTAVWTLVQIFRMFPEITKPVMLEAGVPAVLYNVLQSGMLAGSMRQYTSELCFFLSSNHPYPTGAAMPTTGPLKELPHVNPVNRFQDNLDEISLPSDYSDISTVMHDHKHHTYPFVPYRIDDENMRKIDALFNEGYEQELANALPHPDFLSRFGFDHKDKRIDEMDSESDSDDSDHKEALQDDDQSVNSTISSGSRSLMSQNSFTVASGSTSAGGSTTVGSLQNAIRTSQQQRLAASHSRRPSTSIANINRGTLSSYESTTVTDLNLVGETAASSLALQTHTSAAARSKEDALKVTFERPSPFAQLQPGEAAEHLSPVLARYRPSTTSATRAKSNHFKIGGPAIAFDGTADAVATGGISFSRSGFGGFGSGGGGISGNIGAVQGLPYPGMQRDSNFFAQDTLSSVPTRVNDNDYHFSRHLHISEDPHSPSHHHHHHNHHNHHPNHNHHNHHHGRSEHDATRVSSATATFMQHHSSTSPSHHHHHRHHHHQHPHSAHGASTAGGTSQWADNNSINTPYGLTQPLRPISHMTGGYDHQPTLQGAISRARARTAAARSTEQYHGLINPTLPDPNNLNFTEKIFPRGRARSGMNHTSRQLLSASVDLTPTGVTAAGATGVGATIGGGLESSFADSLQYSPSRSALSTAVTSYAQTSSKSNIGDMLAQLDPLSLNVSVGMRAAADDADHTKQVKRRKRQNRLQKKQQRQMLQALDTVAAGRGATNTTTNNKTNDSLEHTQNLFGTSDGDLDSNDEEEGDDDYDDDDEDEDIEDDISENGLRGQIDSYIVEGPDMKTNKFVIRKKQRIRAEKLIDHTFAKRVFGTNATTAQAQNLITRMESVLQLMDPEDKGFVTWECFSRLLVAVAPSHLLRADVLEFMRAQTDDEKNLIDYKEFIISGKVIIIKGNEEHETRMPIGGWLQRQKLYTGEDSTYTWKNHVKWYQSRRAKAVVWLMRRAARSLKHSVVLEDAEQYLLKMRKKAMDATWLLEIGHTAKDSQVNWVKAKRNLLTRCMHARKWATRVDSAFAYLKNKARVELDIWAEQIRQEEEADSINEELRSQQEEELRRMAEPKKQADYATFYKLFQYTNMAVVWLKSRAEQAKEHCDKQDDAHEELQEIAKMNLMQMLFVEEARRWLLLTGEHAYNYCMMRDDVMKWLFRTGQHALNYMIRQEEALKWLLAKGKHCKKFMGGKMAVKDQLLMIGKKTLNYMNEREDAFAFLVAKRGRAERLLVRRAEAEEFLPRQPYGVWDQQDKREATWSDLTRIGDRAVLHCAKQHKAFVSLQYTAGRARIAQRQQTMAFTDLIQFGQIAKLQRFAEICKVMPSYEKRVKEEITRVVFTDKRSKARREKLPKVVRWKEELQEAFDWIAMCVTPPAYLGDRKRLMGRIGFQQLLLDGKLLGISHTHVYEQFKSVDPATSCYVPFNAVWAWFLHHAEGFERGLPKNKRPFMLTTPQLISAERRAMVTVMKRINSEKLELDSDLDWDALEALKKNRDDDSSESESEFDEFEGMDEDELFSNLDFLRRVDIGRLMRYLTKKKMTREQAAILEARIAAAKAGVEYLPPLGVTAPAITPTTPPVGGSATGSVTGAETGAGKKPAAGQGSNGDDYLGSLAGSNASSSGPPSVAGSVVTAGANSAVVTTSDATVEAREAASGDVAADPTPAPS